MGAGLCICAGGAAALLGAALVPVLLPTHACPWPLPLCSPTWAGSLLACAGTLIIVQDRAGGGGGEAAAAAAAAASALPLGDALTLLAALCYSAACVRIPAWAVRRRVAPLQLALGKAAFLAVVASAALGLQAAQLAAEGQPLDGLWPGWQKPLGWACILWAAVGPGALASVLHVKVRVRCWCAAWQAGELVH